MEVEEPHRSVLAATYHLKEGLELSDRDRDAAQAVAAGLRDAKVANTRGPTRPLGRGSRNGPAARAIRHCPQLPRPSLSTWAAGPRMAGPWPPSSRPALVYRKPWGPWPSTLPENFVLSAGLAADLVSAKCPARLPRPWRWPRRRARWADHPRRWRRLRLHRGRRRLRLVWLSTGDRRRTQGTCPSC